MTKNVSQSVLNLHAKIFNILSSSEVQQFVSDLIVS